MVAVYWPNALQRESSCHFLYLLWLCVNLWSPIRVLDQKWHSWRLDCSPMRPWVILTPSSREEAVFPLCISVRVWECGCMQACSEVTVNGWHWACVVWSCNVLVQAVLMSRMCICRFFVGMFALFVSYTCPVHCDSCTPQQGWTYLQCHPQTWGQQGAPGPLQRRLSFPRSLVPRSTPLLWQVLT